MSQHHKYEIKILLERLKSLQITDNTSEDTTEYMDNMSTALTLAIVQNKQTGLPKSIVLDPEQFNRNRTKSEDQWRRI